MPEAGPARVDPALLLAAGPDEVRHRLQARRPQVGPVGVGALHRVADDHDQPGLRERVADPAHRGAVVQVERSRLAAQGPGRSRGEQGLVVRPAPDVLPVGQRVSGPALGRGRPVGQEELRLLDGGHVERRVFGQRGVQGRGAGLGGADDQEIGHRHGASRGSSVPIFSIRIVGYCPHGYRYPSGRHPCQGEERTGEGTGDEERVGGTGGPNGEGTGEGNGGEGTGGRERGEGNGGNGRTRVSHGPLGHPPPAANRETRCLSHAPFGIKRKRRSPPLKLQIVTDGHRVRWISASPAGGRRLAGSGGRRGRTGRTGGRQRCTGRAAPRRAPRSRRPARRAA